MNIPRIITIKPVLNGYVCTVGCQTVVFDSRGKLLETLKDYLEHPEKVQALYAEHAIHRELLNSGDVPQAACATGAQCQAVEPVMVNLTAGEIAMARHIAQERANA